MIIILFIGGMIYFLKPCGPKPKSINVQTSKEDTVLKKLNLLEYSDQYVINKTYRTIVKDDTIYIVDNQKEEISSYDNLINDQTHFKMAIDRLIHQKYHLSKADELRSMEPVYLFKEHELIVYFENYKSDDYVTVNYNEVKEFLAFEPSLDLNYSIEDCYELDPNKVTIAFTFDDGPNGKRTQTLIETLEKYDYAATFFIVGNRMNNGKSAVQRVHNSHSEIGYHSWAHSYLTKQDVATIQSEFQTSDNLLYEMTGTHFKLTRPPYGSYNDTVLSSLDNAFIMWNLDTNDWKYKDAENAKNYVLNNYHDGSIILFHDLFNSSVEAVKMLAPILKERGVQVTSVSRLAKLKGIDLNNHEVYKKIA